MVRLVPEDIIPPNGTVMLLLVFAFGVLTKTVCLFVALFLSDFTVLIRAVVLLSLKSSSVSLPF